MTDVTMQASESGLGRGPDGAGRLPKPGTAPGGVLAQVGAAAPEWYTESEVHGTCPDRFGAVREAFVDHLNSGADVGASVALFIDGEPVLDLWGGYFDMSYTRPWEQDTIVNTFSTTKTMTALCALVLADRGEIDLDAPVATYWPEFAAAGKERIEVRQLLGFTTGLAGWTEPMTLGDLYDLEKSTALLARQAPWWEPGTAGGYHGFTIGHLIGEVVRRVSGLTLGAFFAREIAGPLGAEYHIGAGPELDRCVSPLIQGCPGSRPTGKLFYDRALFNPPATPQDSWTLPWRRAQLGAVNGHGNARGIAAVQSVLACGESRGVRLLSAAGRERVLEVQADGTDLVLGFPTRWGMGYNLDSRLVAAAAGSRVAWWAGGGGSLAYVDLDRRLSFGYAPNRWVRGSHEQDRQRRLLAAVYAALAQ